MSVTPASSSDSPLTSLNLGSSQQRSSIAAESEVRQNLDDQGLGTALDSLRSLEDLEWTSLPEGVANPPRGLVIGTDVRGTKVVAFVHALNPSKEQILYCARGQTQKILSASEAAQQLLDAPFSYVPWKKLDCLTKWYFILERLLPTKAKNDYYEFSEELAAALRTIESCVSALRNSTTNRDKPQPEHVGNSHGVSSPEYGGLVNGGQSSTSPARPRLLSTPSEEPPSIIKAKLIQHLEKKGEKKLLRHLRNVKELQFAPHQGSWANNRKLHIGHTSDQHLDIWVYLRFNRSQVEISCFHLSGDRRVMEDTVEFVAQQDLIHPFSKTLPLISHCDHPTKSNLALLIMWYFIEAGHAKTLPLNPPKWIQMLQYIDKRMADFESAGTNASTGVRSKPAVSSERKSSTPLSAFAPRSVQAVTSTSNQGRLLDEPHHFLSASSSLQDQTSSSGLPNNTPQTINSPRGSKRPLDQDEDDDPEYAKIEELQRETRRLKSRINADDQELKEKERLNSEYHSKVEKERALFEKQLREAAAEFEKTQREKAKAFDDEETKNLQAFATKHEHETKKISERRIANLANKRHIAKLICDYYSKD